MTVESNMAADGHGLGEELARLYLARQLSPPGWRERLTGLDMAYAAQDAMAQTFAANGQGALAGYKVGMTAKSMQQLVGIDTPIAGKMLSANMMRSGAQLRRADYLHLGIESELAFILSRDIDAPLGTDDDKVLEYIATAHAAFEVVDDRNADFSRLTAASLVAENIWNVGAVLGAGVPPSELGPIDRLAGRYSENGVEIATGMTSDVLGNPLHVVRWLADFLLERGSMLRKGEIILTGSITALRFPAEGTACSFRIDGLPPVDVQIL
ncbi:MAG: fumarylacetoacetate hydrolase family protein [Novosphingobium sp.]